MDPAALLAQSPRDHGAEGEHPEPRRRAAEEYADAVTRTRHLEIGDRLKVLVP